MKLSRWLKKSDLVIQSLPPVRFTNEKKKLTDAKSPADSADSGFASFSKKKLTGAKS